LQQVVQRGVSDGSRSLNSLRSRPALCRLLQVFVKGNHAVGVLQSAAAVPDGVHPRDHWAPAMFLAGPQGVLAAVVAFQRSPTENEWVPHRCAGVELVPKEGEPLFARNGPSKHGLKYISRF
jgi:hypothetical protein